MGTGCGRRKKRRRQPGPTRRNTDAREDPRRFKRASVCQLPGEASEIPATRGQRGARCSARTLLFCTLAPARLVRGEVCVHECECSRQQAE